MSGSLSISSLIGSFVLRDQRLADRSGTVIDLREVSRGKLLAVQQSAYRYSLLLPEQKRILKVTISSDAPFTYYESRHLAFGTRYCGGLHA